MGEARGVYRPGAGSVTEAGQDVETVPESQRQYVREGSEGTGQLCPDPWSRGGFIMMIATTRALALPFGRPCRLPPSRVKLSPHSESRSSAPARKPAAVFCSAAAPPPGCMLDINDPQVQKAAIRIQASYQDHRSWKELREKGPPRVLEPLKDVVLLMEGGAAKLTCRVSAFPDLFIRCGKDRKELRDGPKCRYVFKDPDVVALVVHDGEMADLSQYSVNVTNPFGQCSDSARILVEVPAKIQKGSDNTKARRGAKVTLIAEILGKPAPDVAWAKNGEEKKTTECSLRSAVPPRR
ncbi:LOW QUALITY PROTEIN: SPEG neighbor protein [Bos taurus]|uniref:LOW QUALITY PROTEIN: SPEG neighbor protein n=1 Tax=Bos taurus TaxID=9913 RepID=UPI000D53A47A|nr:LOW QUALITY PROTEIN: SPEG neighbor protein [Bos taurus]